jgi:hypothetical protein
VATRGTKATGQRAERTTDLTCDPSHSRPPDRRQTSADPLPPSVRHETEPTAQAKARLVEAVRQQELRTRDALKAGWSTEELTKIRS